jgi:uncharacterized protein YdaU (DUF1376 family)
LNYFPFHIGDYRAATAHLTNEEDLAYRRLIEMYYDTEQPIPEITQSVSRRLRVATEALNAVLQDFFILKNGAYHHARCDHEIAEYNKKADIARANGRNGGRRKAAPVLEKNPVGSLSVATKNPTLTQALANQEPITNNQEPKGERAKALARPDDVELQVWTDWVQLRKAKKAPVTETVLKTARKEAALAGMALTAFLEVWCARGSQGLEAAWLRPDDKPARFAKPEITATVPSRPGRDPEILKAENDLKNRALPSLETLAVIAKIKGIPA